MAEAEFEPRSDLAESTTLFCTDDSTAFPTPSGISVKKVPSDLYGIQGREMFSQGVGGKCDQDRLHGGVGARDGL